MNIETEIPLEKFRWNTFSIFESVLFKLYLLFNWIFCYMFNQHDWNILIVNWEYSKIDSVDDFRNHCAKQLKCSCCGKIVAAKKANLSPSQTFRYNFYTKDYFNR